VKGADRRNSSIYKPSRVDELVAAAKSAGLPPKMFLKSVESYDMDELLLRFSVKEKRARFRFLTKEAGRQHAHDRPL
jgi:hypothetical protein